MKRTVKILSLLAAFLLFSGCGPQPAQTTRPAGATPPPATTAPVTTVTPATRPVIAVPTTPDPTVTEPKAERFTLSFAGDCTFGDNFDAEEQSGTFCKVVKEHYSYPLSNVRDIFLQDDLTLVNLECALTESDPTEEEMEELKEHLFRFRGPVEYAKILSGSSVELASCANNHSRDYGKQGLEDTWEALEAENVPYASFGKSCVYTTESGLKVGVFTVFFGTTKANLESQVKYLEGKGAELIVMSVHWGDEGTYSPNSDQRELGRMAIDAGVDIVWGNHSHVLQPIEEYNGGIIYYSLGNCTFGGNTWPRDPDTAVLQQEVILGSDGSIKLGKLTIIPCRVSSVDSGLNNFQPTPYAEGSEEFERTMSKLDGTFTGPDLVVDYSFLDPTESTESTEGAEGDGGESTQPPAEEGGNSGDAGSDTGADSGSDAGSDAGSGESGGSDGGNHSAGKTSGRFLICQAKKQIKSQVPGRYYGP